MTRFIPTHRRPSHRSFVLGENGVPDIVYRVEASDTHRACTFDDIKSVGFVSGETYLEGASLHQAAFKHCLGWQYRESSPFISLTASFGWAVWEAVRRKGLMPFVYVVDGRKLSACKGIGRHIFSAEKLLGQCDLDDSHGCYKKPMDFALSSDEFLVLDNIPADTIIGRISLDALLPLLPSYFYEPESDQKGTLSSLVWQRASFYDALLNLGWNLSQCPDILNICEHSHAAVAIASAICCSLPDRVDADPEMLRLQRCALSVVHWLICWDQVGVASYSINDQHTHNPNDGAILCILDCVQQQTQTALEASKALRKLPPWKVGVKVKKVKKLPQPPGESADNDFVTRLNSLSI